MELLNWGLAALLLTGLVVFASLKWARKKRAAPAPPVEDKRVEISYIPSDIEWSGSSSAPLPIKILTYKQYECLEDARYGFKIIGLTPTERKLPQAPKVRAHGLKTVASLVKHGFLKPNDEQTHDITDHGLNALEVCDVRY